MQQYITVQNDRLDKICRAVYGTEGGNIIVDVLEANYGLGDVGPVLPGGMVLNLPIRQPQRASVVPTIKLWGTK